MWIYSAAVQLARGFWVFFLSHTAPGFQLWFYCHLWIWVIHWGLFLWLPWRTWFGPCEDQVWRWCSCLSHRGSDSTRYSGGLVAKAEGNVLRKGMATSIGQYARVFLPGEPPSLTEKPGRPQSTGLQWVGYYWSDPVHTGERHFLPVAALPQWDLNVKVVQLLGLQRPRQHHVCRDMDCLPCRSYGPIRVFFPASCSWRSEGLFGQSFSITPPIQALRRLPCLGSYSVDQCIRHLKGHPGWGPTL